MLDEDSSKVCTSNTPFEYIDFSEKKISSLVLDIVDDEGIHGRCFDMGKRQRRA